MYPIFGTQYVPKKEKVTQRYATMNKSIWVTFQREGIHCYPDAPEGVEFLKHPHRHIFHFRVEVEVFHDDRDIEFILFKRELEALFDDGTLMLDYKSCEMLAEEILVYVTTHYGGRCVIVDVSEDQENGSTVRYEPTTPYINMKGNIQ
jgi:hypothetical protein